MAVVVPGIDLGKTVCGLASVEGTRAVAMALACGDSVVLKSSEMCPATHRLIGTCLAEAGFPGGVVNVISNAPDIRHN